MDKTTVVLSKNWRFHLGDEPYAWQAWYDDSSWKEVTVPHDWSVELPFSRDYSSGGIAFASIPIHPGKENRSPLPLTAFIKTAVFGLTATI